MWTKIAARDSVFGGLCASGWHTLAVWMGLNVKNGRAAMRKALEYDGPDPRFGPSPGAENIKWLAPVMAGDTITYHLTLTDKRKLKSKPGWGLLTQRSVGINQHGKEVVSLEGSVMVVLG